MRHTKVNITFDFWTIKRPFLKSVIKKCILTTLRMLSVPVPCEINVLVTDDKGIRAINKATRDIDNATDVLSFPMFQFKPGDLPEGWTEYLDPETELCPLGDMAISLERTISQAKEYGHTPRREIGYLTIHSMLHLLGYDHMDDGEQKKQMRAEEERIAASISGLQRN